ncbi:MAG TPA: hypothetical protein VFK54_02295 [Candidatus Limnocylindrales bacterium]|nr:hypothetical protein [Candidatus Limnocylindrales bacterium]
MTMSSGGPHAEPGTSGGGPPLLLVALAIGGLVVMLGAIVVTLVSPPGAGSGPGTTPAAATPATSGDAARRAARQAIAALGTQGLQVVEPRSAYRPAESPTLYAAPRLVLQAVLPDDPDSGQFVIYELPSIADAAAAGDELARYVESGVGRVQFPADARFVLRRIGPTLVFFTWSPTNDADPRTGDVAVALETIGEGIPVEP